ncbi:MAG: cupin domain-containing protein [Cyclobacteriaceae bacterium]|nr:cupin domain-containing protein [Cyclobacteriaceae bacterium]MDX5467483.1 cupin domain-containing protein [Cyclobacteriaceae bacterium]
MNPTSRIEELIKLLDLKAHPEGGFYSEVYRSEKLIPSAQGERSLATSIYFLLRAGEVSRLHRIQSDELWFWHEGSPLSVHILASGTHSTLKLGPIDALGCQSQALVPANTIFGSSVDQPDSYALVSCVVTPGFDFQDFQLFTYYDLIDQFPGHSEIIQKLT